MMSKQLEIAIDDNVISILTETLYREYGYDFREYSDAHLKRRIRNRMLLSNIESIEAMNNRLISDKKFAFEFLQDLSITVTEMFRDPLFYKSLRENVIPILQTYPFIKVWHAGCSTGEEAYSMSIILYEAGLSERTTIYATDFNQTALNKAKEGIFTNQFIKTYTDNYYLSGGKEPFSNYYTTFYNHSIMNQTLKKNIVWASHNLVTDSVFAEVNLILCRNVLIYFEKNLQNKVQALFYQSLMKGGILCLGAKESLNFTPLHDSYLAIDKKQRIYKKKY